MEAQRQGPGARSFSAEIKGSWQLREQLVPAGLSISEAGQPRQESLMVVSGGEKSRAEA